MREGREGGGGEGREGGGVFHQVYLLYNYVKPLSENKAAKQKMVIVNEGQWFMLHNR